MASARDLWHHQASRGIWVLDLHEWLQSTKAGGPGSCPGDACRPPVPAVFSPAPQPCGTSGPYGVHSIVSGSPCEQVKPLLPPAPRESPPLCLSGTQPEEAAELGCSRRCLPVRHRVVSQVRSPPELACFPQGFPGRKEDPLPTVSARSILADTMALSFAHRGAPGLRLHPSWRPRRRGQECQCSPCWPFPCLKL